MKEFYRYLHVMKNRFDSRFALATVIRVEGSAYRHEGAKMLFGKDGEQYGTISAGCLEDDLLFHAKEVIESKEPKRLTYDLRSEDDLGWGQGAGCNGKIEVYVEPMHWGEQNGRIWPEITKALDEGDQVTSVRVINGTARGSMLFYMANGQIIANSKDDRSTPFLLSELKSFTASERFFIYKKCAELANEVLFERYEAKDFLYIFGAGPDAEPLVKWAAQLDFYPIVIDPRESRCNRNHFPHAGELKVVHPETFLFDHPIRNNSYVVIMTHSFIRDQKILSYFLHHPPKYLGVLGPKKRTNRLIQPLPLPDWVRTPIGLDIQAEGPEEISISILGELIQVRNAKRSLINCY